MSVAHPMGILSASSQHTFRPTQMMLLIVDDNAGMRGLLRRITDNLAAQVIECADGAAALAAYESHQFTGADWVLMDIEMAGMDGLTATRELRAAHPDARVIIVTRHNDEEVRDAAFRYGACGFVMKENLLQLRTLIQQGEI